MKTDDKFAFLLGAGISRPSGGPLVSDLTKSVIESAWMEHTDSAFYSRSRDEGLESDERAKRARALIRILHSQIEEYLFLRDGRPPNYEDYFACLKQIVQDETGETGIVQPDTA